MAKVIFINNKPACPAPDCGSFQFLITLELLAPGHWKVEDLRCYQCDTEIELDPEIEAFLTGTSFAFKAGDF